MCELGLYIVQLIKCPHFVVFMQQLFSVVRVGLTYCCLSFTGDGVWRNLDYRVTRKKKAKDNIEDMYDGQIYKHHFSSDGFFRGTEDYRKASEKHISFQLNTDGVAIFKSSKFDIWPVYLTINELPPHLR